MEFIYDKQGEENLYCESWGEQLVERHATVICIMDVEASTISLLENVPDDISPGQVYKDTAFWEVLISNCKVYFCIVEY